jgi:hypothetical protein
LQRLGSGFVSDEVLEHVHTVITSRGHPQFIMLLHSRNLGYKSRSVSPLLSFKESELNPSDTTRQQPTFFDRHVGQFMQLKFFGLLTVALLTTLGMADSENGNAARILRNSRISERLNSRNGCGSPGPYPCYSCCDNEANRACNCGACTLPACKETFYACMKLLVDLGWRD